MPRSNLSPLTLGMMVSKLDSRYDVVSPSSLATPSRKSTSQPMILPDGSLYSFGWYGTLMPTRSLPEDLIAAGSSAIAASFLFNAPTVPLLVGVVELLDLELFTQPVRASKPAVAALTATRTERRTNTGIATS